MDKKQILKIFKTNVNRYGVLDWEEAADEILNSISNKKTIYEKEITIRKVLEYVGKCFERGEKSISDLLYWLEGK